MKTIAIFGANGNLGHHAVAAFAGAGWNVCAVTRDGVYKFDHNVECVAADALDEAQVIAASDECDFIFNGLNPLYTQWRKMCMPMARNIMSAAVAHNAVHLFPGNVYNFGTTLPAVLPVIAPRRADTVKGQIRCDMETFFAQMARKQQVRTIVLRGGDYFGGPAATTSWFNLAVAKNLSNGKMTWPGPLDQTHSWAYLPDFAQTLVALAERAGTFEAFQSFNFEGHAITGQQMKTALETLTARTLNHQGIPWALLRLAGLFSPMLREVTEMRYLWHKAHRLDGRTLAAAIGTVPHTPLNKALGDALVELGKDDLLGAVTAGELAEAVCGGNSSSLYGSSDQVRR